MGEVLPKGCGRIEKFVEREQTRSVGNTGKE
jgi:hypothetical protein